MTTIALLALVTFSVIGNSVLAQQPSPPTAPVAPVQPVPPSSPKDPGLTPPAKGIPTKTIPGFLIIGTVFNQDALAFPGAEVRVRRADEKKYRWQTYTNSRGEFAVRVPEGHEYEVLIHVKKFQDQTRTVNSSSGDVQQRLSIRLEPVTTGKNGAKS